MAQNQANASFYVIMAAYIDDITIIHIHEAMPVPPFAILDVDFVSSSEPFDLEFLQLVFRNFTFHE